MPIKDGLKRNAFTFYNKSAGTFYYVYKIFVSYAKNTTSSWHLNRFLNGSNLGSTVYNVGERPTVTLYTYTPGINRHAVVVFTLKAVLTSIQYLFFLTS